MKTSRTLGSLILTAAAGIGAPLLAASGPAGASVHSAQQAVVVVQHGPFGPVLAVGGHSKMAGQSLYFATIDPVVPRSKVTSGYRPGCTTRFYTKPTALGSPIACTGTAVRKSIDWPALTTSGPPVAGRGVRRALLGRVYVKDLGTWQVTYAGHPLYIFDEPAALGANILESEPSATVLVPPWHTVWRLLARSGRPATGTATLAVERPIRGQTSYASRVLGAQAGPLVGEGIATVYIFSRDRADHSACTGGCARMFIPLLTTGMPVAGPGVRGSEVGVIRRPDGTYQVTYRGHPLYLYGHEKFLQNFFVGTPSTSSAGNGNHVHAFGGVFTVIQP